MSAAGSIEVDGFLVIEGRYKGYNPETHRRDKLDGATIVKVTKNRPALTKTQTAVKVRLSIPRAQLESVIPDVLVYVDDNLIDNQVTVTVEDEA